MLQPSLADVHWRCTKYDQLGATHMAAALMAHPKPAVASEAIQMMLSLLQDGHSGKRYSLLLVAPLMDSWHLVECIQAQARRRILAAH